MEQHQQPNSPAYVSMVPKLNQAIFFCFNESSEKLPVSIVKGFVFKDNRTLLFNVNYFPLTERAWNVFAAELHLYKKGMPFSLVLNGIAVITDAENSLVQFTIHDAEYFQRSDISDDGVLSTLFKPYINFYRKSSELLSHTFSRNPFSAALDRVSTHE
jgi:hypothetical protein